MSLASELRLMLDRLLQKEVRGAENTLLSVGGQGWQRPNGMPEVILVQSLKELSDQSKVELCAELCRTMRPEMRRELAAQLVDAYLIENRFSEAAIVKGFDLPLGVEIRREPTGYSVDARDPSHLPMDPDPDDEEQATYIGGEAIKRAPDVEVVDLTPGRLGTVDGGGSDL